MRGIRCGAWVLVWLWLFMAAAAPAPAQLRSYVVVPNEGANSVSVIDTASAPRRGHAHPGAGPTQRGGDEPGRSMGVCHARRGRRHHGSGTPDGAPIGAGAGPGDLGAALTAF